MKIKRFEELKIWKLVLIYNLTNKKKLSKDFKLRDQIRSAIISVSSNIVEGFEKIITMSLLGFFENRQRFYWRGEESTLYCPNC